MKDEYEGEQFETLPFGPGPTDGLGELEEERGRHGGRGGGRGSMRPGGGGPVPGPRRNLGRGRAGRAGPTGGRSTAAGHTA
ncbi:hypothetical protein [Massilia sp. YMA4]|uniref:hypothetical protein n=1 Tax=Massilia sp. YMA4 TaxID=1593482 RepID=UPI0015836FC1|nr:hypothetical protein [Massilia sp. YMA4]